MCIYVGMKARKLEGACGGELKGRAGKGNRACDERVQGEG